MSEEVSNILEDRRSTHGDFKVQSRTSESIKAVMRIAPKWNSLDCYQAEALDLIATKIARILSGNPNHRDSWLDIAGYAELVAKELK